MNNLLAAQEAERLAFAHMKLRDLLLARMPEAGVFPAAINGAGMARRDKAGFSEHRFDRPLASLLVQGSKETVIGDGAHIPYTGSAAGFDRLRGYAKLFPHS